MLRHGVQFHWRNHGYADFDDFLAASTMTSARRSSRSGASVRDAGISCEWFAGSAITEALLGFFNRCYRETYRQHHSTPYLNLDFFRAHRRAPCRKTSCSSSPCATSQPIAASLNIHSGQRCAAATGARSNTIRRCISRPATTRSSSSASPTASPASRAARRASTRSRAACCRSRPLGPLARASGVRRGGRGFPPARDARHGAYVDELNERSPFKNPAFEPPRTPGNTKNHN